MVVVLWLLLVLVVLAISVGAIVHVDCGGEILAVTVAVANLLALVCMKC